MTDSTAQKLAILILATLALQLFMIGYVFYANYQGRVDTVKNQRAGCQRNKLDRRANAAGWRIAEAARRAEGQHAVANKYAKIARGQEFRSAIPCSRAFPKASLFP